MDESVNPDFSISFFLSLSQVLSHASVMDECVRSDFSPFLSVLDLSPQEPACASEAVTASIESMSSFFMVCILVDVDLRLPIESEEGRLQSISYLLE